jgi:hypothetical protein
VVDERDGDGHVGLSGSCSVLRVMSSVVMSSVVMSSVM